MSPTESETTSPVTTATSGWGSLRGGITSSRHCVEVGIIIGCTISAKLFSLAMDVLIQSAEPQCREPRTTSAQYQPPIRAFTDDLKVSTESVPGCRWILQGLKKIVEWAQMCFKPAKSRSLVLRKGKVEDNFRFNIEGTAIAIHHRETNQEPKPGIWQLAVGCST